MTHVHVLAAPKIVWRFLAGAFSKKPTQQNFGVCSSSLRAVGALLRLAVAMADANAAALAKMTLVRRRRAAAGERAAPGAACVCDANAGCRQNAGVAACAAASRAPARRCTPARPLRRRVAAGSASCGRHGAR
jgi:hypothetical protein